MPRLFPAVSCLALRAGRDFEFEGSIFLCVDNRARTAESSKKSVAPLGYADVVWILFEGRPPSGQRTLNRPTVEDRVRNHASIGIVPGNHVNARDCRQITRGRRSDVNGARPWDGHFRTDRELLGMRTCSIAQAEEAGR